MNKFIDKVQAFGILFFCFFSGSISTIIMKKIYEKMQIIGEWLFALWKKTVNEEIALSELYAV